MYCKSCNTRVAGSPARCPNCGRSVADAVTTGSGKTSRSDSTEGGTGSHEAKPQASPPTPELSPSSAAIDLELEETETEAPGLRTGASALRAQLGADPDLLEPGLRVLCDEQGTLVGVGYPTEIGEIDVLARGQDGAFVVVTIVERGPGRDPVGEVLARIGWVEKHLARGHRVRAIVLFEPPPPELGYVARAVADSVSFKTYRLAPRFEDLEV